jgi:16S rRNA (cytosine967-C5)-methyltransferase
MNLKNPRFLAVKILDDIWHKGIKPKDALDRYSSEIDRRETSFLHELVYGVLRNREYLDFRMKPFLKKPGGLRQSTKDNLRLGAYQALFMRVPEWAVVNETTDVEKVTGRNTALVNAVLRRVVSSEIVPELPENKVKRISIMTSHPEWLIDRWKKRYGSVEAEALAIANNRVPPLTLRVNTLKNSRDDVAARLADMGIEHSFTVYSPSGIRIQGIYNFKDISEMLGEVYIQDEASQLITYLLQPGKGDLILDGCAAPGGKTLHIAELTEDRAEIYAVEEDVKRAGVMVSNLQRHDIRSVKVIRSDLKKVRFSEMFDRILLDAPCSALGVIRRNPDVRYRVKEDDLGSFHMMQLELLYAASNFLRPGGVLVYSVCSTEPDEGEEVIKEFLHKRHDFFIINSADFLKADSNLRLDAFFDSESFFRTYPHRHDMDGFFAVRLSRRQ